MGKFGVTMEIYLPEAAGTKIWYGCLNGSFEEMLQVDYKLAGEWETCRGFSFMGPHELQTSGILPDSHSEDLRKIPLWFWHRQAKSNHCKIVPESSP